MEQIDLAKSLQRTLTELADLEQRHSLLRAAHDLAQDENRLLRAELSRLHKRHYPCALCGAAYHSIREADTCHVRHGERSRE